MKLEGSCHCQAVKFSLESAHPYPFNLCYCSICRKTAGGGGFAINLSGDYRTLKIEGEENIAVYRVKMRDQATGEERLSGAYRNFCKLCASALWVWAPRWPDLAHPFASAIDTDLPAPPERTHLMLGSKAAWVQPACGPRDQCCEAYPKESIAGWHQRLGLESV